MRLLWSIAAGCVPVLASSSVAAWFDDALDYSRFALAGVPKAELRALPERLAAVPPARLERMHRTLLDVRRLFLWPPHGLAYNMTLHGLCVASQRGGHGHARRPLDCGSLCRGCGVR